VQTNEHAEWETAHHVFTYANAVYQILIGPSGTHDQVSALRGILHGAMALTAGQQSRQGLSRPGSSPRSGAFPNHNASVGSGGAAQKLDCLHASFEPSYGSRGTSRIKFLLESHRAFPFASRKARSSLENSPGAATPTSVTRQSEASMRAVAVMVSEREDLMGA
jgi:hypothetical protein